MGFHINPMVKNQFAFLPRPETFGQALSPERPKNNRAPAGKQEVSPRLLLSSVRMQHVIIQRFFSTAWLGTGCITPPAVLAQAA